MIQEAPLAFQIFVYGLAFVGLYLIVSFVLFKIQAWWKIRKLKKGVIEILEKAIRKGFDPTPAQIENWLHGSWDEYDKEKIHKFADQVDTEIMDLLDCENCDKKDECPAHQQPSPEVLVHLAMICPNCGSHAPLIERWLDDNGDTTEENYECVKCSWKEPVDTDMGFDQTTTVEEVKN